MTPTFWAVLTVCFGVGGTDCQSHYLDGAFVDQAECARAVTAAARLVDAEGGTCMTALPDGATPLPAATPGAVHAAGETPQPPTCAKTEQIEARLASKWREAPAWVGIAIGGGSIIQLWRSESTWTLFSTSPQGVSCLVAAGKQSWGTPATLAGTPINEEHVR